ncbi:conserved hypothetical protein [Paraburkholderia piptadeniae]|uniref:Phage-related protein n=1 Tax=Paraburkholderia piptadeniae TaxID=1701573 RepID=A0A1N7RV52_9BURK|nr:hypothetical protein [Paraburkholderia piptadeniae]SIT38593.1 conserved hypothetical protein [Paraburkholderia piptadeniae]
MKERPILSSGPMVRAILEGRKTQTRRVVKLPHNNPLVAWEPTKFGGPEGGRTAAGDIVPEQGAIWHTRTGDCLISPHGQPRDRLWVRESMAATRDQAGIIVDWHYAAGGAKVPRMPNLRPEFNDAMAFAHLARKAVPSIDMPRWASRITLEVTGVRVERLHDIKEDDAKAEGCAPAWLDVDEETVNAYGAPTYRQGFARLWRDISGDESWDANPWVWVVGFRRVL